jgi:hypothetical protein
VKDDKPPQRPQKRRYSLPGCKTCDRAEAEGDRMKPPHDASSNCESGKYDHCTCDTCY